MKYLALIIIAATITSCQHLRNAAKHGKQNTTKGETIKQRPFSGDIVKLLGDDVVKVSSNTSKGIPLIESCGISPFQVLSPDKSKVALICSNEYFNALYIIDLKTDKVYKISQFNRKKKPYYYSFAWSGNDKLFFGYEDHVQSGSDYTSKHGEVLAYNLTNNTKRNIGCSVSKRVLANIDNHTVAVSAGLGSLYIYIVKKTNCATVQRFPATNKSVIHFSPDGNYYTYYDHSGNLFINSLKNDKEILLAKAQVAPEDVRWSPDGNMLSFDKIVSSKTGSRQVVIYAPSTGKTTLAEKPSMVSNNKFTNAFWSPNGNLLIYQSSLTRFNGDVVKGLHLYSVANHEVANTLDIPSSSVSVIKLRGWIDGHHILLTEPKNGLTILQVNGSDNFVRVKANKLPLRYSAFISLSLD